MQKRKAGPYTFGEVQKHVRQARHNLQLHAALCQHYPEEYPDWKITMLFYTALHWVHALAQQRRINIGSSHAEIERSCNPRCFGVMPLPQRAWDEYQLLIRNSHRARYDGIMNFTEVMWQHCLHHEESVKAISYLRKYLEGRDIPL